MMEEFQIFTAWTEILLIGIPQMLRWESFLANKTNKNFNRQKWSEDEKLQSKTPSVIE